MQGASVRPVCPRRITSYLRRLLGLQIYSNLPLLKTLASRGASISEAFEEMGDLSASLLGVINGYFS